MRTLRTLRTLRALGVLVAVAATGSAWLAVAPDRQAQATSYRFWTYWTGGDTGWAFANVGPSRRPADGAVEGWRFAVSAASSSSAPPRTGSGFGSVCGSTPAVAGSKRVALVVDFGTTGDAPPGEAPPAGVTSHCAVVPTTDNGYQVLDAVVTSLRVEGGLVCGIDAYPARGCGEAVAAPTPDGTGPSGASGADGGTSGSGSDPPSASPPPSGSKPTSTAATSPRGGQTSHAAASKPKSSEGKHSSVSSTSAATTGSSPTSVDAASVVPVSGTDSSRATSPVGVIVGLAVAVGLGAAAFAVSRRRRSAP
ncbi:MAG: SCO2322 family protein [Actinomycetes bacterium]